MVTQPLRQRGVNIIVTHVNNFLLFNSNIFCNFCFRTNICNENLLINGANVTKSNGPDLFILNGEFVVVGNFFPNCYRLFGIDNNFAGTVNLDDFRITIWLQKGPIYLSYSYKMHHFPHLTRMVDESGQVSTLGGVHHIVKINTK